MLEHSPAEVQTFRPKPDRVVAAKKNLEKICPTLLEGAIEEQVCLRPCFEDAVPMIGRIKGNVFIVNGGNCWGITWGPAMGSLLTQLICNETPDIDLTPFYPHRFTK